MTTITEIVPELDTMPDWFREAFESGHVFSVALATVTELEARLDDVERELKKAEKKWWDAGIIWAAAFMVQSHKEESYAVDIILHSGADMKNGIDYDVEIIKKALDKDE